MSYTVGAMAKKSGLSRTALLYYDSIGLLCPSGRTSAGYRVYEDEDWIRLEKIIAYRETGMSLKEIIRVLDSEIPDKKISLASALIRRLGELNGEIASCRSQQNLILEILKRRDILKEVISVDAEAWSSILNESGIDKTTALKWHSDFEKYSPAEHREFMKSIGFSEEDIKNIRAWISSRLPRI